MKHSILCVDDEPDNLDALERVFRRKYKVLKAGSGPQALQILQTESPAIIISDQRMPQMTGVEFLAESMKTHPDAIRLLLTGYTDIESVISAINSGQIYRYLTKPWDPRDLEIAVDRAAERFEMRVALKVKNQELALALKELQSLDEAKSNFMILINHELKTPLTAALSFLELMKESQLDDSQTMYLDRINRSMDRLKEIVFDVLELTSAELGILPLEKRNGPLPALLEKVVAEFSSAAKDKGHQLVLNIPEVNVMADPRIIPNVLKRLLGNAIKFGDTQSPIEISARANGRLIRVAVKNSGTQLSPEMIRHVLKPFALNENVMNHSKGMGLGLALCQALLRHHSSELHLSSQGGQVEAGFDLTLT